MSLIKHPSRKRHKPKRTQRGIKHSPQLDEMFARYYYEHWSLREIAEYYGYGQQNCIVQLFQRNGIVMHRQTRCDMSAEIKYETDAWCTDRRIITIARDFMGGIDIDPATNDFAQRFIQATVHYTKETNGLNKPWRGRLWFNPPYSWPLIGQFIDKLLEQTITKPNVTEGLVLVNTCPDTSWYQKLTTHFCFGFGKKRFQFEHPHYHASSNRMGQTLFYIGSRPLAFYRAFDRWVYPPVALMKTAIKISHDQA